MKIILKKKFQYKQQQDCIKLAAITEVVLQLQSDAMTTHVCQTDHTFQHSQLSQRNKSSVLCRLIHSYIFSILPHLFVISKSAGFFSKMVMIILSTYCFRRRLMSRSILTCSRSWRWKITYGYRSSKGDSTRVGEQYLTKFLPYVSASIMVLLSN